MAGEVRFRLNDNTYPLQTLDICHEIVNMTFCSSERSFTLKKCLKKRSVDRYDSSESSDSGVATFITELGSPMTPDSRGSEYSIPSPVECESVMAPPPPIQNSADEIDLTCWPWSEEWPGDCSNIELFSDTSDTEDCKVEKNTADNEINKDSVEDSCTDKLGLFRNPSNLNNVPNIMPLKQCENTKLTDNIKSECEYVHGQNCIVPKEESRECTLYDNDKFSSDFITSLKTVDDTQLLNDEKLLLPVHLSTCTSIKCSENDNKTANELHEMYSKDSVSTTCTEEKLECNRQIDSSLTQSSNNNLSNDEINYSSPQKKICLDMKSDTSDKSRYFMRSSLGTSYDLFQCKASQLVDQNKNLHQASSLSLKSRCSLKNHQSNLNGSLSINKQLIGSQKKNCSGDIKPDNIRFPKLDSHWISLKGNIVCRWNGCDNYFNTTAKLIEHLQVKHVNIQKSSETYVCLWNDCKVFNKPSCSRSWLERHVLSHGGNKPLQCIVQKCRQRFSSQVMLERHVNQHFKVSNNKEDEGISGSKLIRRKGKKLRLRRQPFSARKFDYFDQATMMELQTQLFLSTQNSQHDFIDYSRRAIKFRPNVIARRLLDGSKNFEVMVRWFPPELLDDEWITCDKNTNFEIIERVVPIMSMSTEDRDKITKLFGNIFPPAIRRSRK
ncbi:uncharacterized protein LOC126844265 isoform X2 [Adelges cooleyi]|uniref:uncharacterized protein LOC126844265 isoform X2 n=1 Tax=Adelges cooleyi TaxID=133065 RepID=UPI0021800BBB|nr:uncharacterized protein LOC126844265 isoform X2 [Adelges cooleyi]